MGAVVSILGTRGSVPVNRTDCLRYGGATLCVALRIAGQTVMLDAGTGMLDLPHLMKPDEKDLSILISHPHLDHLLGLPMCPVLFDPLKTIHIYGANRNGLTVKEQIQSLMSPPLWPVGPEEIGAKVIFYCLETSLDLGEIHVDVMEGYHPGGVSLFRVTGEGKSVVYITDCTLTDRMLPQITEFAQGCDLLLCDGQYSEEEWPARSHFGHNTWKAAAELAVASHAKQARIIHHDPFRTDTELDLAAKELTRIHPKCTFAYAGEEVIL